MRAIREHTARGRRGERRAAWPTACTGALLCLAASGAAAQAAWAYTIGEQRPEQQVNLCTGAGEAREIAAIFRKYGVRAGYTALAGARACSRRVAAVTPVALLDEIAVTPVATDGYHVRFVAVRIEGEASDLVLVTTRAVHAGP